MYISFINQNMFLSLLNTFCKIYLDFNFVDP